MKIQMVVRALVLIALAWCVCPVGICVGAEQPTAANLKLVGGYRVPSYIGSSVARMSTGFVAGGMAAHTFKDGTVTVWHETATGKEVLQSSTSRPMGAGSADPNAWPLLSEAKSEKEVWTAPELFGDRFGGVDFEPEGIAFDPETQSLWVSTRSRYATGPDAKQWLAAVDYATGDVLPTQPSLSIGQQPYGGGMTLIPNEWAAAHTGGRRLAFASGGYRSGQRASMGPTFAAVSEEDFSAIELMKFPDTANAVARKARVARAIPDYGPVGLSWVNPPEGEVGYWPGGSIKGNGAWVDFGGGVEGVLYMSYQPTGTLDYNLQNETFSKTNQNVAYFVHKDRLEEVAGGQRAVDSLAEDLTFFRWTKENNGGIDRPARSLSYDPGSGYLWVYYPHYWSSGVERHPIVAAYEIVTETAFVPGDFDRNGQVDARDFVVWRADRGRTVSPGEGADANRDGVVDVADYIEWRQALAPPKALPLSRQNQEESRSLLVPEPNAICSAIAIAALMVCRSSTR